MTNNNMGSIELNLEGTIYTYKGVQLHFHHPAEHTFTKKQYPLEMHIVHALENPQLPDYQQQNLVIAVYFEYSSEPNLFIQNLDVDQPGLGECALKTFMENIDLTKLYHYKGSLTTPPCTECVNWISLNQVQGIQREQVLLMAANWGGAFRSNIYIYIYNIH